MQKRKLVRILDIVLVALLVANIVSYTHKKETKLLHANYNILVQESAGSSNYVEYPGLTFPTRGYVLSSYTCENHATITQNSVTKALNFDGSSNKCTLKFNLSNITTSQTLQKLQSLSNQWQVKSGNPNFGRTSPREYFIHGGFNTNTQTNTVNANRYITYASDFIVDPETGKYSLVNPQVMLYSNYGDRHDLEGQYVVAPTGSTSNQLANYQNLDTIYKVTQTHMIGLTYYIYTQSAYTSTAVDNSECGIYSSPDNYGTSYYVRGKYDYNYVKFGKDSDNKDLYWRIVRINGDESLRIIYAGTSATAKSNIGKSKFNETIDDNTYVGYMTGTSGASSYAQTHNNVNNSTIKTMLDNWYNTNLLKDDDKIAYNLFCNDRSLQSGNGYGMDTTYYKSYNRNITNKSPSLLCPEKNDRFTVNDTTIGNGKLTRPIGLITEDELAYGGMVNNKNNTSSYLSKTDSYWTMTPADFATEKSWVMGYYQNQLKVLSANSNMGVVPVINLTPEAVQAFTGTGTSSDPFVVTDPQNIEPPQENLPTIRILQNLNPNITVSSSTPHFANPATTDEGMFAAPDDYGISYYWRGTATTNYVRFAGFYWRAVRINGDGSLRLYYDGTSADAKGNIGTGAFNSITGSDNTSVGYMYGTKNATSYDAAHTNTNDSTIKTAIDTWYQNNLLNTNYENKISDTLFCNDRSLDSGNGYGTQTTKYKAYNRLITNKAPILTCPQKNDRFTVSDTDIGNGALTYPIGLITADEVVMTGSVITTANTSSFLYRNTFDSPWTMTPYGTEKHTGITYHGSTYLIITQVAETCWAYSNYRDSYIIPVVNIKNEALQSLTGQGTKTNPFVVH